MRWPAWYTHHSRIRFSNLCTTRVQSKRTSSTAAQSPFTSHRRTDTNTGHQMARVKSAEQGESPLPSFPSGLCTCANTRTISCKRRVRRCARRATPQHLQSCHTCTTCRNRSSSTGRLPGASRQPALAPAPARVQRVAASLQESHGRAAVPAAAALATALHAKELKVTAKRSARTKATQARAPEQPVTSTGPGTAQSMRQHQSLLSIPLLKSAGAARVWSGRSSGDAAHCHKLRWGICGKERQASSGPSGVSHPLPGVQMLT